MESVLRPFNTRVMIDSEEERNEANNDALTRKLQPQEHQIEDSRVQWEELHCRSGNENQSSWEPVNSEYLPLDGILSSNESIATNESLLSLTLTAAGIDFCEDSEAYPFQHFQYFTEESEKVELFSTQRIGWHVNCCDSPQQPSNQPFEPIPQSPLQEPTQPPSQMANVTKNMGFSEKLGNREIPVPATSTTGSESIQEVDYFPFAVTQVFVSIVAAFLSLATILAMTLPLLKKRRRKRASTYNLYLVFLAVPDLIYNLFLSYLFVTYEEWTVVLVPGEIPWIDHPFDLALFALAAASNLYMNVIIALEILKLLRNSKRRRRSKAPSLKKASIQALCTYTVGIIIFALDYNADKIEDKLKRLPKWVIPFFYFTLTIALPMAILLWVCFRIYREKLIGDVRTKAGKRLSILIRYFTRIIVVYICIWLPASVFYLAQFGNDSHKGFFYYVACVLYALAAWANFALSLTKPDVRKNFKDLFTGKAFMPDPKKEDESRHKFTASGNSQDRRPKENRVTTSTGEESVGATNHIETDLEQGSPEREKATIKISFSGVNGLDEKNADASDDDDERDSNVFDFAGADAPRLREFSKVSTATSMRFGFMGRRTTARRHSTCSADAAHVRSSMSESLRVAPRSSTYSNAPAFRSSLIRSSEVGTMSEPFELHSQSIRDSSRTSMERQSFTSSVSSNENTNRTNMEPKAAPSMLSKGEEQDEEITSSVRLPSIFTNNTDSSLSTTPGTVSFFMMDRESGTSGAKSVRSYKSGATIAFFMDMDSSGNTISEKERRNWILGMKKNIRDLGRLMRKPNVSEEQKSIYRQSIYLNQKALESVHCVSISQHSSERSYGARFPSSTSLNLEGVDISSGSELTNEIYPDEMSSDGDDNAIPGGSDHSKNSDEGGDDFRYSKTRWLTELRRNIQDLNLRLEEEDLTEEDRMLISRAIESQTMTMASIEGIDENADAGLFTSLCNSGNVDQSKTKSFISSSLDVIDDNSVSERE